MPRHEVIYDREIKATPEWRYLYHKWRWVRQRPHCDAFEQFSGFYDWANANGFVLDSRLVLLDDSKPYSPENCLWAHPAIQERPFTEEDMEWISLWDRTVNRLRRHFGLRPFKE